MSESANDPMTTERLAEIDEFFESDEFGRDMGTLVEIAMDLREEVKRIRAERRAEVYRVAAPEVKAMIDDGRIIVT